MTLLMVSILLVSTGLAAAKPAVIFTNTENPANRVVIYRTFVPEATNINAGESITWVNLKRPKAPVVLMSEEGICEETTLYYGKTFTHTFEEPGSYTFTLKDNPGVKLTVTVHTPGTREAGPETTAPAETGISAGEPLTREATAPVQANPEKSVGNDRHEEKKLVIYNAFVPDAVEIKAGETVTWVNFKKPKHPVGLISEEGLWEEKTLYYGKAFSYTFEETGTYTFGLKDNPEAKATVLVK
ncbi:cupredoxin domain-containing protein [Methanosarcina sp. KYL-1]|uniref:cupredoxin domain-containing protein n=1 Tax=Methanosarcina sp. KYL-1 TaxID=2602068 RepID=UPI002101C448|nr:cupredoxin domain-containing protein [Methanosarcina sp. KYL-1]